MQSKNSKRKKLVSASNRINASIILFFFSTFLLIALKPAQNITLGRFLVVFIIPILLHINLNIIPSLLKMDRLILAIINFLSTLGVLILYSTNPDRGVNQIIYYVLSTFVMVLVYIFTRYIYSWSWVYVPISIVSVVLLLLPVIIGKETNGAKNWIYFGKVSIQPSEIVKISLIFICAYSMSRYKKSPWILFMIFSTLMLMLQKDLGALLLYFSTCLIMFYVSSGSLRLIAASVLAGAGSAIFSYYKFAHIKKRVSIWQNPWADFENSGYQLIQSLVAIASGGLFGVGLGLGKPSVIPIYYTDFIFSVIVEQFGIIFSILIISMYALIVLRGAFIARSSQTRFHALMAIGCTSIIVLQCFVIIAGVTKMIPLTGVTLPFVSYGGSSLLTSMGIMGILQGVAGHNIDSVNLDKELSIIDNKGMDYERAEI